MENRQKERVRRHCFKKNRRSFTSAFAQNVSTLSATSTILRLCRIHLGLNGLRAISPFCFWSPAGCPGPQQFGVREISMGGESICSLRHQSCFHDSFFSFCVGGQLDFLSFFFFFFLEVHTENGNLPPVPFVERPGSVTCFCDNTGDFFFFFFVVVVLVVCLTGSFLILLLLFIGFI